MPIKSKATMVNFGYFGTRRY